MNASVASLWGASAPRFFCLCSRRPHSAVENSPLLRNRSAHFENSLGPVDNHSLLILPIPTMLPGETESIEKDYRDWRRSTYTLEDMHSCGIVEAF